MFPITLFHRIFGKNRRLPEDEFLFDFNDGLPPISLAELREKNPDLRVEKCGGFRLDRLVPHTRSRGFLLIAIAIAVILISLLLFTQIAGADNSYIPCGNIHDHHYTSFHPYNPF